MTFDGWKWLNESRLAISEEGLSIYAPEHTDWFRDPIPGPNGKLEGPVASAPVFYTEIAGDFVFSAKVKADHKSTYEAGSLMVIENDALWVKLAFEASDFGTRAAVCVVTNEVSDDANGCDITQDHVWLKIVRVGSVFSAHYSLDGKNYHMVRLFCLPMLEKVKVGLEVQCPTGQGSSPVFSGLRLEQKTVADLRRGV